ALADLIGRYPCVAIMEVLHDGLGDPKYAPCPLLRQYVAAGRLGRKSGRGVYQYSASSPIRGRSSGPAGADNHVQKTSGGKPNETLAGGRRLGAPRTPADDLRGCRRRG